jgi:hypothetical protein
LAYIWGCDIKYLERYFYFKLAIDLWKKQTRPRPRSLLWLKFDFLFDEIIKVIDDR